MYVRASRRKNKDGTYVEYLQLAHNVRVPGKGYCKADVVYNFGRKDELDLQAIQRLVKSLSRFLSPEDALEAQANADISSAMRFIRSASDRCTWVSF